MLLWGCSTEDSVGVWHQALGGRITEDRAPTPNANAPYPNLSEVPPRPALPDAAARNRIANALQADRASAQYGVTIDPVPVRQPGAAPSATNGASNASLAAASAATGPVSRAATTLPSPAPSSTPAISDAAPNTLPSVPFQPPAPPVLPGVVATTAPTPPRPIPPGPPPTPVRGSGADVVIGFANGSAILPQGVRDMGLKLAKTRGDSDLDVVGFGGAASAEPAVQQDALPLAFARARAIAAMLRQVGVPLANLRVRAMALGTGGLVRIADD